MGILSQKQLIELQQFDVPTVANALERFGLRSRIEGFTNPGLIMRTSMKIPMIGYAATAKVSGSKPGDEKSVDRLMEYYASVREEKDPTVAVIQDLDKKRVASFWGEVQSTVHLALGAIGTITDGGVRDLAEAEKLGFYFFSTEVLVSHGYIHVEESNCPVNVCGMQVCPGDLVMADHHGAIVIPEEAAEELAEACRKASAAEIFMLDPCRQAIKSGQKPTIEELRTMRKNMDAARVK